MDEDWKRYLQLAGSGALTGGGMGAVGKILSGSRSLPKIGLSSIIGALTGATTIPAASYIGEEILGKPEENEYNPYMLRAGIGGGVVGGLGGGILGALGGSGIAEKLADKIPGVASAISKNVPLDNIIVDQIKKRGGKWGAGIGAIAGAAGLGYLASDEGQQMDTIRNAIKRQEQKNVLSD
jgi:hypothetical protein